MPVATQYLDTYAFTIKGIAYCGKSTGDMIMIAFTLRCVSGDVGEGGGVSE